MKGLDLAASVGQKGIKITKKGIGRSSKFLCHVVVTVFLIAGILSSVLAFVGVISLDILVRVGLGVLANDPWAIVITIALASILSIIATALFSMPEGCFTKIALGGAGCLIAILMIAAFVLGTLTVFALTTAIVFFSGALFFKKKFRIETPLLSLVSGSFSILLTVLMMWVVVSGSAGIVGDAGNLVWLFGSLIIGLLGVLLLSDYAVGSKAV